MSRSYAVDLDELAHVLDRMRACQLALHDLARDVATEVGALHAGWSGLASEAHAVRHDAWAGSFERMRDALEGMRGAGCAAHDNYVAAAEVNRALWRQVR